ncbi:MAG: response regulator [Calditrichaeota bacterium]|nr:MAG: response regulator [Calditrichota bacterium]MBL1206126.1 response regulator [Calditrichota bacterium]NOG45951.1 response regulator [Calditrichota bacterium]
MVVDDSLIIQKVIQKYLESLNIEIVGTASDGKAAVSLFKEKQPDIVTLDITMPEMDGLAVLEELLKINDKTKVMVVTALSDKATGLKAIKTGAKSFLAKPFTPEGLRASMKRLISEN